MSTRGRPTGYRPEYAELAGNYCKLGATNAQLADFFKVARRTIDNWIVNFPEFAEAVRGARVVADERMWRAVYQCGLGYNVTLKHTVIHDGEEKTLTREVHKPPNMRAAMIWFRNRGKWAEKYGLEPNEVPGGEKGLDNPYDTASGEPVDDPGVRPDPGFSERDLGAEARDGEVDAADSPGDVAHHQGEDGAGDRLHVDNDPSRPEAGALSRDGMPRHQTWIGAVETWGTPGATDHPP